MSNHNPIVTIFTFVAIVFHFEWHALCCTMSLVRFTNELFAHMPYDHTKTMSICEILNVAYVFSSLSFWIVLVYFYQCLQSSRSQVKSFVSFIQRNQRSTAFRALLHIYVDFACLVFNKTPKRKGQYVLHKVVICANLSTFMYEPKNFSVDSSFCWVHFCWVHRWKSKKKERQR